MGVPSIQKENQISSPENPKLPISDLNSETNHRETPCFRIDPKNPVLDDVANNLFSGKSESVHKDAPADSHPPDDVTDKLGVREPELIEENGTKSDANFNTEELRDPSDDVAEIGELEPMVDDATCKNIDDVVMDQDPVDEVVHGVKHDEVARNSNYKGKGKNEKMHSDNSRVLRSHLEEKAKVTSASTNLDESCVNKENIKKKKKKAKSDKKDNGFLRIKKHLKYLLTRMSYEQNLIDAYSGEGWKGQSLEKIKPEKELERAESEIFRCKLKIRDLFQRIHSSCTEGSLLQDLFDSEGEIDSEDIFCAKCGSKDLPANNDIILCDGACERGFHQLCLDPPLLSKDIPPGDEGWLCPGCECKDDCIELLNDSQGTNLTITNSWEDVFAEAAAAASATDMADVSGLPSDDSEDDDYDPDGPHLDNETQYGESSSSDESDFSSASDDMTALNISYPNAGFPSDESDDHDYNPDCQDTDKCDEKVNPGSHLRFTSDSEYYSAGSDNNGERSGSGKNKRKNSLGDELLYLLEVEKDGSAPLADKRHVERLDYKMLYDEEYGDASSDSNDEEFSTSPSRKRRKTNNRKNVNTTLPNGKKCKQKNQKENEQIQYRKAGKKEGEIADDSPSNPSKKSSGLGSNGKSTTNRKLGEPATQSLLESFKENRYPSRITKESLAKDLSLTFNQVSKWFENARWSANHSANTDSKSAESARKVKEQSDKKMHKTEDCRLKGEKLRRSGRVRS